MTTRPPHPENRLTLEALREAYDFISWQADEECVGYVCRRTGKIYLDSPDLDSDELPEGVDDSELYAVLPGRSELELGREAALDFVAREAPLLLDTASSLFRSSGAFRRFKDLLQREQKLESWYEYEAKCVDQALHAWCDEERLTMACPED